jgi:hypothetical protein
MRLCCRVWAYPVFALGLATWPAAGRAVSCTTQAELQPQDRAALTAVGGRLAAAVLDQDYSVLQSALLPAEAAEWDGIRSAVESAAPLVKGGQVQLRNLYLLDAVSLTSTGDTQFFCSNTSGSLTVTLTMRSLPPGKYAVILADALGTANAGQLGIILAWDGAGPTAAWKLAGLTVRQGSFDAHDGVWYWTRARELVKADQPWAAFFCYEASRLLLVPVDFLSSPNLDKLTQEQGLIKNGPQDAFPLTLQDGPRTWKIDSLRLDPSLREPDLAVTYESTGVTEPAAIHTEAVAVLSAFLKSHPEFKENFHGLWAYALKDGKRTAIIELPMTQIP